ncbi:MAG: RIP metalloprotease RseP [Burkholderiaceae bacterium]|jgi:regulator of sigma E protease
MTAILSFLLAIALLVFVHEWGHYIAARSVRVPVEKFSIGFGRVLFSRKDAKGCEWAVSAIPLGGFVKMDDQAFEARPLWARAWVVSAGPLANLVFAVLAYTGVFMIGQPEPVASLAKPVSQSQAATLGLAQGDRVIAIDGEPVETFGDLRWALLQRLVAHGELDVSMQLVSGVAAPGASGPAKTVRLQLTQQQAARPDPVTGQPRSPEALIAQLGLRPESLAVRVAGVQPGSPAEGAGLRSDQVILAVNGQTVSQPADISAAVSAAKGRAVSLLVTTPKADDPHSEQPGSQQTITVTPIQVTAAGGAAKAWRLGVSLAPVYQEVHRQHGVWQSAVRGLDRTVDMFVLSWQAIGRMVVGSLSWRELSGPVSIAGAAGQSAAVGLAAFVSFLALISVSIGVLNLMPIPMLDGGHLLYYLAEWVRGKPLSVEVQQLGQRLGLVAILVLTGLALFNDVLRVLGA